MALTHAVPCMDSEQEALLKIKEGFIKSSDSFSSWTAEKDCCKWRDECDNTNGHPQYIGPLQYIEYLNLSNVNFLGTIPILNLSGNSFSLKAENLNWICGLSSAKVLDLGGVDLSNVENRLDAVNLLPNLVELRLFFCKLHKLPLNLPHFDFTSLKILDLSHNDFSSTIAEWLFDIGHSLVHLNLSRCQLQAAPGCNREPTSLTCLDLSMNNLEGPIPLTLGFLAQLSRLIVLDMAGNNLEGSITEAQLLKFRILRVLDLSSNRCCQLSPKFPLWLCSQKNLSSIDICNAGIVDVVPGWSWNLSSRMNPLPGFSANLRILALAASSFFGTISRSCEILSVITSFIYLDTSKNNSSREILGHWKFHIDIIYTAIGQESMNHITGELPLSLQNCTALVFLDLGENKLLGSVPTRIGENLQKLNDSCIEI
ncbi:hypothetical protein ACB092_12G205100 [Castanea dentata]